MYFLKIVCLLEERSGKIGCICGSEGQAGKGKLTGFVVVLIAFEINTLCQVNTGWCSHGKCYGFDFL